MIRYGRKGRLLTAAGMAVLIAACEENKRPIDAPPPAPLAEFDSGGALAELPYAEPAQVRYYQPEQAYPYAERAYGLQRAFYDAPPDYGFSYDDISPYVWETADDWTLYAEPWEGDYRYYYYEPGAAYPYFIRDDDYGYAFSPAGLLIAMFYPDGRYAPADVVYSYAPLAGRYYARGGDLRRVERRVERFRISDDVWMTEAPRVSRSANPWLRAARDDRRWREWRERNDDRELRRFQAETRRREEAAEAWRERAARQRVATIERREDRLEAAARDDRRERRDALQEARGRAEADRRQARVEQRRVQQRAEVERRREAQVQAERQQAQATRQAERRRDAQAQAQRQESRAELQRRAEARSMREQQARAQAQQQRAQQQAEARRAQQAELRRAGVEQRRQLQAERRQAEAQQRQQAQAERQARREQQARAPSAAERGKPAAANEDEKRRRERENRRD